MPRSAPLLAAALAALTAALPASAGPPAVDASLTVDAAAAAIDAFALAIDTDRDGRLSPLETAAANRLVFASIDADGDGGLTALEMTSWPQGFRELAAFRNRTQAYDAAFGVLLDLLDRDRDGRIDADEHARGMAVAARLADVDGDGALSMAEFRRDFLVTSVLRRGLGN